MEYGPITTYSGAQCMIRPLLPADLNSRDEGAQIDPRWCALRWLGDDAQAPGEFHCVAWLDHGRLFIPVDGQSLTGEFVPDGTPDVGGILNYRRGGWYDAETGRMALARTSMPVWHQRTGLVVHGSLPELAR